MGARKTFDIRHPHGVVFGLRTVDDDEETNRPGLLPALVFQPNNDAESYLTGPEVEALHQFTYEVLAGAARDPRLVVVDSRIMCGWGWTYNGLQFECGLEADHMPIRINGTDVLHVSSEGQPYEVPPF